MGEYTEGMGLTWRAVTIRLGDLQPWGKNPRRMRKEQAERLLRSWAELGQFQTIAIGPAGEVYDGHQRLSALLSAYGPDYQVQALQASRALTEAERMRLTLAANNPVGEWDWEDLREWPQEVLAAEGMGQELVQALYEDARALARIWASPVEASAPEPKVEVAEELREKWGTAPGQLWIIPSRSGGGAHRLYIGDATREEDVRAALGDLSPTLMVTDPPYGVEYDPEWRERLGINNAADRRRGRVVNDDQVDWSPAYALFPGVVAYIWHAGVHAGTVWASLAAVGFEVRAQIIWKKPNFAVSRGHYHWAHEPCYYAVRRGRSAHWTGDRSQSTVWEEESPRQVLGHATTKPVGLYLRAYRNHGAGTAVRRIGG